MFTMMFDIAPRVFKTFGFLPLLCVFLQKWRRCIFLLRPHTCLAYQ